MKIYECVSCGESYYKQVDKCPFCDSTILIQINGTEEEVLLTVLLEIKMESEEYEQFNYDSIAELIKKKLGKEMYNKLSYSAIDDALKKACEKEYFTEMTFWISSA